MKEVRLEVLRRRLEVLGIGLRASGVSEGTSNWARKAWKTW